MESAILNWQSSVKVWLKCPWIWLNLEKYEKIRHFFEYSKSWILTSRLFSYDSFFIIFSWKSFSFSFISFSCPFNLSRVFFISFFKRSTSSILCTYDFGCSAKSEEISVVAWDLDGEEDAEDEDDDEDDGRPVLNGSSHSPPFILVEELIGLLPWGGDWLWKEGFGGDEGLIEEICRVSIPISVTKKCMNRMKRHHQGRRTYLP